jgi:glucose/arabinose dehydrogenase
VFIYVHLWLKPLLKINRWHSQCIDLSFQSHQVQYLGLDQHIGMIQTKIIYTASTRFYYVTRYIIYKMVKNLEVSAGRESGNNMMGIQIWPLIVNTFRKQAFLPVLILSSLVLLLSACGPLSIPPAAAASTPESLLSPLPQATPSPEAVTSAPVATLPPAFSDASPTPDLVSSPAGFPDPSGYAWNLVVGGFSRPVDIAEAGDGSGRLFIVEQAGEIRVVTGNQIQPSPFLDIRDRVGSQGNEQGLLGVAFHPNFKQNGFFYVNYTDLKGNTVIARFTAPPGSDSSHPTADPGSEMDLLHVDQPFPNHNAGQLAFGPDHYLWFGLGDGGSAGDPHHNGQSLNTLLGKMLRIDVDHGSPYAIPPDNPFVSGGGLPEIWAFGLRNPWRFTFDRQTGDLYIADVGQNQWEEIDYLPIGFAGQPANFGWNQREGKHPYKDSTNADTTGLVEPVFEYSHDQGCSVSGGPVYRGQALPAFQGVYLFGDYCSGMVWGLIHNSAGAWDGKVLFQTGLSISSFGQDQAGEIYLADLNGGLYRLEAK